MDRMLKALELILDFRSLILDGCGVCVLASVQLYVYRSLVYLFLDGILNFGDPFF